LTQVANIGGDLVKRLAYLLS